jgi:GNAT superfamily N-acetyltransferase
VADPVIRRATDDDVVAIALLRRQWTEEEQGGLGDPGFEERFAVWYAAEAPRRVTWLAEAGGEPVGMMNLVLFERMPRPGRAPMRWGYLSNAFVLKAHRDLGIGRRLLDALLAYAVEHDFVRVVLSPSDRAVPFYERAGFGPADTLMLKSWRE